MVSFQNSFYLVFLLFIPILLGLYGYYERWRRKTIRSFGESWLVERLFPGFSAKRKLIKFFLTLVVVFCLSLSLAGPVTPSTVKVSKPAGSDIAFVVDVSASMLAEDVTPNRLERTKHIINMALQKLTEHKVTVVAFAGVAYPHVPLTSDHVAVHNAMEALRPELLPVPGSSLENALLMAIRCLKLETEPIKEKNTPIEEHQPGKIIFLLSDGEDNNPVAKEVLHLLNEANTKIYTLGIGSIDGSYIPVSGEGKNKFKKDKSGKLVISRLEEQTLKSITGSTGGDYHRVIQTDKAVSFILAALEKDKQAQQQEEEILDYEHLFQWPVGLALIFLILEVVFFEKKSKIDIRKF